MLGAALISIGMAGGALADEETPWTAFFGELEQVVAAGNAAELIRLDQRTFARLDRAQASANASELALRFAELREARRYADPWYALDRARQLRPADANVRFDERLARGYLLVELPWKTIEILEPARPALSADGRALLETAKAAIAMIRGDVRTMGNNKKDPYEGQSPLARRALDLLGVPPLAVGRYADLNYVQIVRVPDGDLPGPQSLDFSERPMLSALHDKTARAPLSDSGNGRPYRAIPPEKLSPERNAIVEEMKRILRDGPRRDHQAALLPLLAALIRAQPAQGSDTGLFEVLGNFYSENEKTIELYDAADFDRGVYLTIVNDSFSRYTFVFSAAPNTDDTRYDFYLFKSFEKSVRALNVDGEPGDEIIMEGVGGSGGYLDLEVFDPGRSQLTRLVEDRYHGAATFLNLDTDPALELVVTHATGNRRFADCNQCASRRMAVLFDFSSERGRYETVAQRQTATDTFAQANRNLFGVSPTMYLRVMETDVEAALQRIAGRTASASEQEFVDDARTVFGFSDRQFAARQYIPASDLMDRLLTALAASPNGADIEAIVRRSAYYRRLQTLVHLNRPDELEAAAQSADITRAMRESRAFRADVHNLLANGRLETGAFDAAYQSFDAMTDLVTGESRGILDGNLAHYLNIVGAHQAAYTAALRALDHSHSNDTEHSSAINMIHLAMAAAATGRTDEAMDWVARAMRLANNLRDADIASMALSAVVDLLLDRGEAEIALRLLDHVIVSSNERVWTNQGSPVLRQYGKGLAMLAAEQPARDALDTAIRFGERRRGADFVAALLERSRMAEAGGQSDEAGIYAQRAFDGVLDGRAR
ncbi:MAG: hypothetical protein AAGL24_28815, partial [Pseudomonadota bacterium]